MKPQLKVSFLAALSLLAAAGCSKKPAEAVGSGRPAVAVETAKVAPSDLQQAIEVVGALTARSEAEVKPEYNGTVAEIYVSQWVRVTKGKPLARLDTREVEAALQSARAATLQAEVGAQRAARELERTLKLKEAGLATQQVLDEAQTAAEAARAAAGAAKAQQAMAAARVAKAVLRSPIDGVVAARNFNVGDFVEAMPMFRIVDNRVLELTANIPSARMAELKVGQPFTFVSDAIPGKEFNGKISFINPTADEASRTVKVKAEIPNDDETLKAGLFVKGRVVTGSRAGVIVVPRAALVSWDTAARSATLFVVEKGAAKRRTIETGAAPGETVEVVSGLAAGEEVVTRGGFNLRDGDQVRVVQGV